MGSDNEWKISLSRYLQRFETELLPDVVWLPNRSYQAPIPQNYWVTGLIILSSHRKMSKVNEILQVSCVPFQNWIPFQKITFQHRKRLTSQTVNSLTRTWSSAPIASLRFSFRPVRGAKGQMAGPWDSAGPLKLEDCFRYFQVPGLE